MHPRGKVETVGGRRHTRASIWIEQEIAVAAFLAATRDADLPVLLYVQRGIEKEGIREHIKVNPIEFDDESEVVSDFVTRISSGRFRALSQAILSRQQERIALQRRARGEELHSLAVQWLNLLGGSYLRRNSVMQGKLTYNQCLDLDIAAHKEAEFEFSRLELLIDVDFPETRELYERIIAERTKLHRIEGAFRRSYERGEHRGEEFLGPYIKAQHSLEELAKAFQSRIRECIRATGV